MSETPNDTSLPVTEEETETKKRKFYRNPKVVGGVVLAAIAAGITAVVKGRSNDNSSNDSTPEESDLITDIFEAETPEV